MSGFFALKRHIIENLKIDSAGYKILLEILVKSDGARKVKEIPYTFTNRTAGKSKLDNTVIRDYIKAVYHLYRYGRTSGKAMSWLSKSQKAQDGSFLVQGWKILHCRSKWTFDKLLCLCLVV